MRIAIVKLSALGDIVHAMIVLQFIKKFNQEISIDWFVEEQYKDLMEFHPQINKVRLVCLQKAKKKKSILKIIKELNKLRHHDIYDLVIDMQGLIKSAIISKLIPSKQIIGFDKFSIREKLASNFYNKKFNCPYETNVIIRNISLIEFALGFSIEKEQIYNKVPFLYTKNKDLDFKITSSKKNILLIPGASHPSKLYSLSKLIEITKLIDANFFVIWGNHEEQVLAIKIKENSPKVHVCRKLKLDSLILLTSKVNLVIGSDTGPTHISWALNVPSITLFGSTPGYRNAFQTPINKVIESSSFVNPNKINKEDFSISDIDVEEVCSAAKELLI